MSYSAEINREHRSAFFFLVDQSASMADVWGGSGGGTKAAQVADVLNRFLGTLIIKCTKDEGVRDYFDLGLLGYGENLGSAWRGGLDTSILWSIREVADRPLRIEDRVRKVPDGAGGLVDTNFRLPIWVEPTASGPTPMCDGLSQARELLDKWVTENPESYPPIVINITDGDATDGDPTVIAEELRDLSTSDGHLLVFNVHLSSAAGAAIVFPSTNEVLADPLAQRLFEMSSPLTQQMIAAATQLGHKVTGAPRGMSYQSDLVTLVEFIDIGTRVPGLR